MLLVLPSSVAPVVYANTPGTPDGPTACRDKFAA
jgi:hypothetical protein